MRPSIPMDRSTVIELPALEDLLQEARTPTAALPLETPPRGWKPGIHVARPRTRPQLLGLIALGGIVIGSLIYVLVRFLSSPPILDQAETEPVALPQAEVPVEDAPTLLPFTGIEEITWQQSGNGAEIVVRLDGFLPEGAWSVERMSDPPRHLVKLIGASRPYPTQTLEVGFGGVYQLRTGYHGRDVQHVVIDLVGPRVVLEESVVEGSSVRLRFRPLSP